MKKLSFALLGAIALSSVSTMAFAQAEAIMPFYEMKLAPKVCNWKNVPDAKKLDAKIADMETGMKISSADKAKAMKDAEADLKADPGNCEVGGMMDMMFRESVK